MNKSVLYKLISIFIMIAGTVVWTQEDIRYSRTPGSFRRTTGTLSQSSGAILLPTYQELAKDSPKGITLEQWQASPYFLSGERFFNLDQNKDGYLTREELAQDNLQGEAQVYVQSGDLIAKYCKHISNYKDKLRTLKKMGYGDIEGPVEYIVDNKTKPSLTDCCQIPDCPEVWTKQYVKIEHGHSKSLNVCLGHYALLHLEEYDRENSLVPYLLGIILIGMVVAISILVPMFLTKSR